MRVNIRVDSNGGGEIQLAPMGRPVSGLRRLASGVWRDANSEKISGLTRAGLLRHERGRAARVIVERARSPDHRYHP